MTTNIEYQRVPLDEDAVPMNATPLVLPHQPQPKKSFVKRIQNLPSTPFQLLLKYRWCLGFILLIPGLKWEIPLEGPLNLGIFLGMLCIAYCLALSLHYLLNFIKEICFPTIKNVRRFKSELLINAFSDRSLFIGFVAAVIIYILPKDEIDFLQYSKLLFLKTVLLFTLMDLKELTPLERLKLSMESSMGIGKMSACAYYFGYLKQLMSSETEFMNRVQLYKGEHGTTLDSEKLHIIIPNSCQAPRRLIAPDDDRLEPAGNLTPKKVDRGGVIEREFHNSVFRINREKENKKHLKVIAEVATPLLTLHEICEHGNDDMKLSHREMKEERELFCQMLEKLLEKDEVCGKLCKLVRVPDKEDSENGIGSKISDELEKALTMSNDDN